MLFEGGLLVSLPALELRNASLGGSLFGREALLQAELSQSLQAALAILDEACPAGAPLLFVARPEMFADGAPLDWLKQRCRGVIDHLCVSDGATLKLLAGFRNHVFFHNLGRVENGDALGRLEQRVPEIFTQAHSQVNSSLSFRWKDRYIHPQTLLVERRSIVEPRYIELRRLFLNRNSAEDSAARTLARPPFDAGAMRFEGLHYVRLTPQGLQNAECARKVADLTTQAFVNPRHGVIFVMPRADGAASPTAQVSTLAEGLLRGGARLPGTMAPNILVTPEDLPMETLRELSDVRHLIVDDADDFWRRSRRFYAAFDGAVVYARRKRHDAVALQRMFRRVYGDRTMIAWSDPASPRRTTNGA